MNLKWISFNSYQSADSMQILRQEGFATGSRSMDKESLPYDVMKTAFYDGRVRLPVMKRRSRRLFDWSAIHKAAGLIIHPILARTALMP